MCPRHDRFLNHTHRHTHADTDHRYNTHIQTPPDTHTQIHTPRHTFPRPTNSQSKTIAKQNFWGRPGPYVETELDVTLRWEVGVEGGNQQSQSLLLFLIDRCGGERMMAHDL